MLPPNYAGDLVRMDVTIDVKIPPNLIDNISKEFLDGLPRVLNQIGLLGDTYWKKLASEKLMSSRRDYIRSISYQVYGNSVQLTLGGSGMGGGPKNNFVLAVELGGPKFDMKPGFLNSPKARTGPRKFPRELRDKLKRHSASVKYMIIPIVKDRSIVASGSNVVFRTVHSNSPSTKWWHPGWKGVRLADEVVKEMNERIVPEAFKPLMDGLK